MAHSATQSYTTSLAELPADILLHVVACLDAPDILRLRRSSKSFQHLTTQYSVWHHAYHNSPLLTQTLPADATAVELERAVVKAQKLDKNWSSPFPRVVKSRSLPIDANPMALFRGRYVVTHLSTSGLSCHDLDLDWEDGSGERPIAQYEDRSLIYRASGDHDEASGFLTFLKEYDGANANIRFSVVVMRLDLPPKPVAFHLVAELLPPWPAIRTQFPQIQINQQFVAVYTSGAICLWNIHTLQMYKPVPPTLPHERVPFADYFLTERYLLVNCYSDALLEVFPLPSTSAQSDTSSTTTPILISRSHWAVDPYNATQLTFTRLNSRPSVPLSSVPTFPHTITALGFTKNISSANNALRVSITLHYDGSVSVESLPSVASLQFGYWLLVSSNQRCARGVCFNGMTGSNIALISMSASESSTQHGSNEEDASPPTDTLPEVKSLYRHLKGTVSTALGFAFDGAAGRVCVSREGTGVVEILDFV